MQEHIGQKSEDRRTEDRLWGYLLVLRHRDGWSFGVIEAVHGVKLHDHVQAVGQDQNHEQSGHEAHPDAGREESGAVTGVGEVSFAHVKALDLQWGRTVKLVSL